MAGACRFEKLLASGSNALTAYKGQVTGVQDRRRYLWSAQPPQMELADDITPLLSIERYPAMLHLDLVVIGKRLAENSPKPLFLIDLKS